MTKDQYANYVVQKMLEVSTCWHAVLCCAVLCCDPTCRYSMLCSLIVPACLCCAVVHLVESACCAVLSLIVSACCAVVSLIVSACCAVVSRILSACRRPVHHNTLQNLFCCVCICVLQSCSVSMCSHLQTCAVFIVSVYSELSVKSHIACLIAHWNNCLNRSIGLVITLSVNLAWSVSGMGS